MKKNKITGNKTLKTLKIGGGTKRYSLPAAPLKKGCPLYMRLRPRFLFNMNNTLRLKMTAHRRLIKEVF